MDKQNNSSMNTSINKSKLPAVAKKIDWELYAGGIVLDIGGGKFDNFKEYLWEEYHIALMIYDKYNRTALENEQALSCSPDLVLCSNVLNVIDSNAVIADVCDLIQSYDVDFAVTVYAGDGQGIGKTTLKDCYQRNETISQYLRYFDSAIVKKQTIISNRTSLNPLK